MPDPRLSDPAKTANEILQDRTIRHAVYLERLKAGEVRAALADLNEIYDEIIARTFAALDRIATRGASVREFKSIKKLLADVKRISVDGYGEAVKPLLGRMEELAAMEGRWALQAITQSATVPVELAAPSRALLRSIVHNEPFGDPTRAVMRTLKGWFDYEGARTAFAVESAINLGLRQSETVALMTRRVRDTFGQSRRNAETWVRTAVNNTVTLTREAAYRENENVVKGVQLIATLDSRTTLICAGQDGKVYPVGEGPRPPLHPKCRTATGPALKSWREMGIPLAETTESTRASMNGQVPASISFDGFARNQDRAWQDGYFGRRKAQLFRGGVPVERFTDSRLRPLTVAEIERLEGLA